MREQWKGVSTKLMCPFTGRAIKVCAVGPNWVGVSEGPGGGWTTGLFPDRAGLMSFLVGVAKDAEVGEPAKAPLLTCPITGKAFRIAEVQGRGWVASVADDRGGYSTTPFWSRRHLEYFLSTRAGVPPLFGPNDVVVRERTPPPPPDPMIQESKERQEVAREAVDKTIHEVGIESGRYRPRTIVSGAGQRR